MILYQRSCLYAIVAQIVAFLNRILRLLAVIVFLFLFCFQFYELEHFTASSNVGPNLSESSNSSSSSNLFSNKKNNKKIN